MKHSHFKNKGMTLIEIVAAIGIFLLVMIVVANFQVDIFKFNKYTNDVLQSSQDAKSILRTIVKELRSAEPGDNGAYAIITAATSSISFYSDIDADGKADLVRYFLATTTLRKGVTKPSGTPAVYNTNGETFYTLAYNIKNATSSSLFEYFNSSFSGTSTPLTYPISLTSVRLVRINLLIDADPNRSPDPRMYTSDVTLRNLKDNI